MSTAAQIAVLPAAGQQPARARSQAAAPAQRPAVQIAAFGALGLYGALRWSTLLSPAPTWRLLGLLGVCLALAAGGVSLFTRSRVLAVVAAAAAIILAFVVSGIPLAWVWHVRLAVTARLIGNGLAALPRVFVPYNGINQSVRVVSVLGAAVLMIDAGLLLVFAPRPLGDLRRAGAALPLIALAVVPSTLVHPQVPYLQGLLLFGLLAVVMWGERVRRDDLATVLGVVAVVGVGAVVIAPRLDQHKPWLNYQALAGNLAPTHADTFDWSQNFGPLNWPRTGHEVLEVRARSPEYWKAEVLDSFDGREWAVTGAESGDQLASVDPAAVTRWTQTIQVTVEAMTTTDVIAAGYASQPAYVSGALIPGTTPGTWLAATQLGPGDSYTVNVYTPHPTTTELAAAGTSYPVFARREDLSLTLPESEGLLPPQEVQFAPFGSHVAPRPVNPLSNISGTAAISGSPYAQAYTLARRLARTSRTPYAYVSRVMRYLSASNGFVYDENPPSSEYPLSSFLFSTRLGYCQHFAGALALLLRMGGIPARVASGFATGTYDNATHSWVVSDVDAHQWVEAWFPHYGWVRFDATPLAAPALGGRVPITAAGSAGRVSSLPDKGARRNARSAAPSLSTAARRPGHSQNVLPIVAIVLLLALIVAVLLLTRASAKPTNDELLGELERALARSGRPVSDGVTLAELEHRFSGTPEAAGYVRAIRLARFSGAAEAPNRRQRRALRAQLRAGLGATGIMRALWALPPQWHTPTRVFRARDRGIHFS